MRIVEKHPLLVRWTHWINAPALSLMIWSGLRIYWANRVYWPFFPKWFFNFFHLHHNLADGMAVHFTVMWIFAVNGFVYVLSLAVSGEWRELIPRKSSWREAFLVMLHDLGLRKTLPPQGKFNAAQKISYTGIILMGAGSLITGLAIYKPSQLWWLTALCGGYGAARAIHFALTIGFILFIFIHVGQVIKAGWNNFRAMVAGFEITQHGP